MGLCTINGTPVSRARITMFRTGCWVADVVASAPLDLAQKISGSPGSLVTIAIEGGLTLKGSPARAGEWLDTGYLRVLPGNAGMGTIAKARSYRNVSASVIVKDLLATAGEKLAPSSSSSVLATQFPFYVVQAAPVGDCLAALLMDPRISSATWRSLVDGTVWIGTETWPDSGLQAPADYQDVGELPHQGVAELGFEAPTLVPGLALEGRNIANVEHNVDGESCRTKVWFEDAKSLVDRLKAALYAIARSAMPRLAYAAPRFARVVSSATASDGSTTLDVAPEDSAFPTLQRVPLFHGEAGEELTLVTGTRVLVEFSAADPSRPFVRSWAGGETVLVRTLNGKTVNVGGAEAVPLCTQPLLPALATLSEAINAYAVAIAAIADPTKAATPTLTTALQTFATAAEEAVTLNARGQ